jgi:hypothetical protein
MEATDCGRSITLTLYGSFVSYSMPLFKRTFYVGQQNETKIRDSKWEVWRRNKASLCSIVKYSARNVYLVSKIKKKLQVYLKRLDKLQKFLTTH